MFIETETTPNPATLKFLPGQQMMPPDRASSPMTRRPLPLRWPKRSSGWAMCGCVLRARLHFGDGGRRRRLGALKPQVVAILLDHFISGAPLFNAAQRRFLGPGRG
jgi:hypothetical protein